MTEKVAYQSLPHVHKDGKGLNSFQIHRLWQQVFMDALTYGDTHGTSKFQNFTREQLQFMASAAERFGAICYEAGFYLGQKTPEDTQ